MQTKRRKKRMNGHSHSLGNTPVASQVMTTDGWIHPAVPQTSSPRGEQQEKKMELAFNSEMGAEASKRSYLSSRAYDIFYSKDRKLERKYGLANDPHPKSAEELIERIKAGTYMIRQDQELRYYCPVDQIIWRDPAIKKDQTGYDSKSKDLQKEFTALKDKLAIGTPEEGLTALQTWEAAE